VASHAIRCHPRWKREFARLEPRLGRNKAKVAIARRMLIMVWHLLSKAEADDQADPVQISTSLMNFAYEVGISRLGGQSAVQFVRNQLDDLGIGVDLKHVSRNKKGKRLYLPPSRLDPNAVIEPPKPGYQFGCATLPKTPDPRTRAERIKVGLSDPNGPKKKRKPKVQEAA
jgi:hypothetical protein